MTFHVDNHRVPLIHGDIAQTAGNGRSLGERSPDHSNGICETCGNRMVTVYDGCDPGAELYDQGYYCLRCGWWYCATLVNRSWARGSSVTRAALKAFLQPTAAENEACSELVLQPSTFRQMDPHAFEVFVQGVFRHYFDCEVRHVGKSHDGGVDLLVVTRDEGILPVQIKRRSHADAAESVSVVREFLGAMVSAGYTRGIFVSSADRFSRSARSASRSTGRSVIDYDIQLLDCGALLSVCGLLGYDRKPMRFISTNQAYNTERHFAECQRKVDEFNEMLLARHRDGNFASL